MEYKGLYILVRHSNEVSYFTTYDTQGIALSISEVLTTNDFYESPIYAVAEQGTGDDTGQFRILAEPFDTVEEAKDWIDNEKE